MRTKFLLIPIAFAVAAASLSSCAHREGALSSKSLTALFKEADRSGDGRVSRDEFTDLYITEAFRLYDKDGSGVVTLEEYIAGGGTKEQFRQIDRYRRRSITLEDAKASRLVRNQMSKPFNEADKDGNGYITLEEFIAYRKKFDSAVR